MKMFKRILLFTCIIIAASQLHAANLEVVSVDYNFRYVILKELPSKKEWQANIGDTVSGWRVEGITPVSVSVSKLHNGYILITKLPVPEMDFSGRQQLPMYMNITPIHSLSGRVKHLD
jgi:hypothetical protein